VVSATQMVVYVLKGHDFTCCGKTQKLFQKAALYQGTILVVP